MTNVQYIKLAERILKIMKNNSLEVAMDKIAKLKFPNSNIKLGYENAEKYYSSLASELVSYDIKRPYITRI